MEVLKPTSKLVMGLYFHAGGNCFRRNSLNERDKSRRKVGMDEISEEKLLADPRRLNDDDKVLQIQKKWLSLPTLKHTKKSGLSPSGSDE